jgi:AcrR family transcriptional regulator
MIVSRVSERQERLRHHAEETRQLSEENATSERIVSEARRRFYAFGFRSVTMDDIAGELGMSKKTLYTHFRSKDALLRAVMLDKFRSVSEDLERVTSAAATDFPAGLHQLLACVQGHMEEIRPPFVRDIRQAAPELFKLVENRRRELIHRYFGMVLGEGVKTGIIRNDIPLELVVEILLGAVQAIMNPEKMAELDLTPKQGFSSIISVILEGVITDAGRARL